ncbi:DUF1499 [Desulfonema limicola]|uniref:DUF1499 n=1 Tax=Desulfonema limicola TaxID=45656 RepID=A0A975GHN9_9BACT|nr:DUF1499 domain-containing protein [Desulfonema limicola]QTA81735.1 DUF1499 [Desulfonema limicola]
MKSSFTISGLIIFMTLFTACSGQKPDNIGITRGKLAPCPSSPNCVISQDGDKSHSIEPIAYKTSRTKAFNILEKIIESQERAVIIDKKDNYLYAEFRTKIMRFVDDVEFYFPENEQVIHVRSASRLGYSDMGVNRKRVENIRSLFQGKELSNK